MLPGAEQREVTVDGPGATVDLAPVSAAGGVQALRLVDAEGVAYWLEYRTAAGRDAWLARPGNRFRLQSGVLLRRAGGMPDTSLLLDGTPSAASGWAGDLQVALPVGTPVPVAGGQFSLTVTEVSTQDASVTVTTSPAAAAAGTASGSGSTPDRLPGRACGTWTPDAPCPAAPGHAPAGTANSEDAATTMSSGSSSLPDDARPPVADGAAEDAPSGAAGAVSREADRMRTPALTEQVSGPGLTPTTLVAMGGVLGSVTLLVRTTSRLLLRAGRR